eukprot:TRINITY_DN37710_c0_g1_i1.p1 TRINITY_DN37710_c0_g1~~TRINITY_DN37710_c0_g1_i1.p1  ORF type:complete len:184 (-),score=37.52 TRINITY_DN37710_c0_g1_i1:17-520(-)
MCIRDRHWSQMQQEGVRTVQSVLETAICCATHDTDPRALRYNASSRTDAGVHAAGQVVTFQSRCDLYTAAEMCHALNSRLPEDMAVVTAEFVDDLGFDPRRWARGKWYRYLLHQREARSALRRRACWEVGTELDVGRMRAAAAVLLGRHDFTSFCGPHGAGGKDDLG